MYDVSSVRGLYASLGDGWTYFNAHEHPQVPEKVVVGATRAFRRAARPLPFGEGVEGDAYITAAREAIADFTGADSGDCVILGPSVEALFGDLMRAMQPVVRRGATAVLSTWNNPRVNRLVSDAVSQVRWAQPNLGTGELPAAQFEQLADGATRLVVVSAAHPLLGTVAPVGEIVEASRERSRTWVVVDASAYAPYRRIDMAQWDADILALDLAQLGGPQMGALVFREESKFSRIDKEQLFSPISYGDAGGALRTVEHYASLVPSQGSRREQLAYSMEELERYLQGLGRDLLTFIGSLPSVHIMGASGEAGSESVPRIPRISFAVRGVPTATVQRRLVDNQLLSTLTPRCELLTQMGADELGGTVTVALGPYNQDHDIAHLARVVASLA